MSINGGEIDFTLIHDAIMWPFNTYIDALAQVIKADGVPLLETCHPYLLTKQKGEVRVRQVRLGGRDPAVVDTAREAPPKRFAQHVPAPDDSARQLDLKHHIEARHNDQQSPPR